MNKRIFIFFCMVFLKSIVFGQPNPIAPNLPIIIPPSPNARQFTKYGEYPVSHFTGVPQISIPLYTIRSRDIEVPISLSYHASGIKPNDQDGIISAGWTLHYG
ncbi:MAG TPA: hypothetical protein PKC10_15970, partial [Cyclobacteriaceae bacterium]|nr:hypothetical protein [Cyclobacteriaceae bacterium]